MANFRWWSAQHQCTPRRKRDTQRSWDEAGKPDKRVWNGVVWTEERRRVAECLGITPPPRLPDPNK